MAPTILRCGRCRSTSPRTIASGRKSSAAVADQYRKLRNTFRYLLGALAEFGEDEKVGVEAMPELERYMLHVTA
jgi:isoleucyl-tRNA synthetase